MHIAVTQHARVSDLHSTCTYQLVEQVPSLLGGTHARHMHVTRTEQICQDQVSDMHVAVSESSAQLIRWNACHARHTHKAYMNDHVLTR